MEQKENKKILMTEEDLREYLYVLTAREDVKLAEQVEQGAYWLEKARNITEMLDSLKEKESPENVKTV